MTEPLKIEGLREFSRGLKAMDNDLPKQLRRGLNEVADEVIDLAASRVPLRTGAARRSLKSKSTRTLVRASGGSSRVPYYPWLDFGGRVGKNNSVVRPFLRRGRYLYPAYDEMKASGEFEEKLEAVIRRLADGAGIEVD